MIPIRRILPRDWLAFCSLTLLAAAGTFAFSVRRMRSQESQPPRTVFVHLFEWRWQDIARECEVWLSPKGYAAVQISPPNEHRVIYRPDWNPAVEFPWYQRYQPVSYKLHSRSGTRTELEDMVRRCSDVGVKIYADIVFNHMVISDTGSEIGIAGSPFSTELRSYPAVPYNASSFREDACIIQPRDYRESADRVRRCQLNGLQDLKTDDPQVQQRIADYMNDLISIGVAGFRLDASKHVHPDEIAGILARVDNLNSTFHPQGGRPFVFQEVIDLGGEAIAAGEYFNNGSVTEFRYGQRLGEQFRQVQDKKLSDLRTFGEGNSWQLMPSEKAIAFTDNHDNQRGHGAGGYDSLVMFYQPDRTTYALANVFMLAHPYGYPKVMSSYDWERQIINNQDKNDWIGPPHHPDYTTKAVTIQPDGSCGNGWICEHRWRPIANMVGFRNATQGVQTVSNWWDNGENQIAFSRGNKGFVVINQENAPLQRTFQTGLPAGEYCNVIAFDFNPATGACTGAGIQVNPTGEATIEVHPRSAVALHVGASIDTGTGNVTQ